MDKLPVFHRGDRISLGPDEITIRATCADTGGALFAVDVRMPPGGGPPVLHRHDPGEVYYVREGEFTFYLADPAGPIRRVTATAGAVVPLPGGTPHTVRNESDRDAVAFVVHAPGGPMEGFSRAVVDLSSRGAPTMQDVLAVAAVNGIQMLGPVPVDAPVA